MVEYQRQLQGLSLRALSDLLKERTGVSIDASGIQRIEAGAREPRLGEAIALASAFGVRLDELIDSDDLRVRQVANLMDMDLAHLNTLMSRTKFGIEQRAAVLDSFVSADRRADTISRTHLDEFNDLLDRLLAFKPEIDSLVERHRDPSGPWAKQFRGE